MRNKEYLPILLFDGMERLHDLVAPLLVLGAEDLIECQKAHTATAAEFAQCLGDGDAKHQVGKVDLSTGETLDGVAYTVIVDEKVKLVAHLDELVLASGDGSVHF